MFATERFGRSWTGIESINSYATNQNFQFAFFGELSENSLRTSFNDELSEPWQKTPVEL